MDDSNFIGAGVPRQNAIGANEKDGKEKWWRRPDNYSSDNWQLGMGPDDGPRHPACLVLPPIRPPKRNADKFLLTPLYILTKLVLCMHGRGERASARGQGRVPGELSRDHVAASVVA